VKFFTCWQADNGVITFRPFQVWYNRLSEHRCHGRAACTGQPRRPRNWACGDGRP